MKKETWQDAFNELDEKWAGEYARLLQKDMQKENASPDEADRPAAPKKYRSARWIRWGSLAAALTLGAVLLTTVFIPRLHGGKPDPTFTILPATTTAANENAPEPAYPQPGSLTLPASTTARPAPVQEVPQQQVMDGYEMAPEASFSAAAYRKCSPYGFYGEGYGENGWNTEEYSHIQENSFLSVRTTPFSTFAADVDTASYANLRRMIRNGQRIPADAVRIEELINYFHYEYAQPKDNEPFGVTMELADCPWNPLAKLLLIGLQAEKLEPEALPPSNLVFLIDVSGSMDMPEKLPLVQRSFMTLAENLSARDKVTIITYSSGERMVLDGVSGAETARIMGSLEELEAGGSTNGQQALKMAYEAAARHFIPGGNNRIILATDGDFNVGITSESELVHFVKEEANKGVFLSVLGYGMGNYKDNKMEAMADNGNGNYYYIDDIAEARKVLIEEAGGTLFTVARDVKLQVEFNPAQVKGYRLIGYENRVMAAEDFANDSKDGGEIGAGHQVTALFEIIPAGSDFEIPEVESRYGNPYGHEEQPSHKWRNGPGNLPETFGEWLVLNIRYKEPEGSTSTLLSYPLQGDVYQPKMSDNMRWAAGMAQWGMLLTDSEYKGHLVLRYDGGRDKEGYNALLAMLEPLTLEDDLRQECLELIRRTSGLKSP